VAEGGDHAEWDAHEDREDEGHDPELHRLKTLLIERTEGNPFFLEETVQTLAETGALVGERGAHRLTRSIDTVEVPATVQAVLTARIDRLPPAERRLLEAASVIGKDAQFALLKAITELPEDSLQRGLATLQAAELLYETRLIPDLEYTFKHTLVRDVAYDGVLPDRRGGLHARIVGAIERLYRERLVEHVERLADHALRALQREGRQFDFIVLDPPKFAPTAAHAARASRAYKDINLLALKLLAPRGLLVTFSCSGGVDAALFQKIVAGAALDANVRATIVGRLTASADHPVLLSFPEGEYLKGLLVRKT
jgi:hypothetical protein